MSTALRSRETTTSLAAADERIAELAAFLRHCDRLGLERLAAAVEAETETAEGEIAWWRATTTVATGLRRARRGRMACNAAQRVQAAVVEACNRTGFRDEHRDRATRLVRAAGDAARALVLDEIPPTSTESVLRPFSVALVG